MIMLGITLYQESPQMSLLMIMGIYLLIFAFKLDFELQKVGQGLT